MTEPYKQLEIEWANFNKLDPLGMVCCSSGTAALHLALEALQLPAGSKCILPDYTMIACARAVSMARLTPVFVDCRHADLLMDTSKLANALIQEYRSVKAIMSVAVYGRVCENDRQYIADAAKFQKLRIIEDLAEAHGIKPHPHTDTACWSFYRNKIVAGEEGGAVWFRNPAHANLARSLRSMGFTEAHDYTHIPYGHNYRLANALALPILDSLNSFQENMRERRMIEDLYNSYVPNEWHMPERQAPWVYDLRIRDMTFDVQNRIVRELRQNGYEARHGFKPMSTQQEYIDAPIGVNAMRASREVVYLPINPGITNRTDIMAMVRIITDVLWRK